MRRLIAIILVAAASICTSAQTPDKACWVATWATAPERIDGSNMPETPFSGNTLRQVVHVSLGSEVLRLKLSNEFSTGPLEIKAVYIADPEDGWKIISKTSKFLKFNGKKNVVIPAGEAVWSDPLEYDLKPLQRLAITINYGEQTPQFATCHRGSRTTSYILDGESKPASDFSGAETIDRWYNICALEVPAEGQRCFVVLGDSITDGNGTTTNAQNRWTDFFAEGMEGKAGVLNLGIGASSLVRSSSPDCGALRFDRDVLGQAGATDVIVYYGVNDIGGSNGGYEKVVDDMIACYQDFIRKAHDAGLRIYLATITPIGKSFYYTYFHEAARRTVNDWIRNCKDADGVIDFDAAVVDPADRESMKAEYAKDYLHMNPTGYAVLGDFARRYMEK